MAGEPEIGRYAPEEVGAIVRAYVAAGSYLRASLVDEAWWSPMTVYRVVAMAVVKGIVSPEVRNKTGRPRVGRERIFGVVRTHPELTNEQVARLAGVSLATVYRAKREVIRL